ncbi:P-loop containing nucleoside triphosphate hydrolase protein [Crucibulum laeve]|uniref:DNA repair protein RAD51 homolog 3 n=1 Tax=Crucibulum laeve TaxID=68775 RepID=A0A5C3LYL1_9AGAR|nr:P-loop containing nucleoside triphosphate hydrolase protein [Crucibulum laeve]
MASRSLISLGLPKASLVALTTYGYETIQDLLTAGSPEELSTQLKIPISEVHKIFASTQKLSAAPAVTLPLTQSAAAMAQPTQKFSTRFSGIDQLLGGGISLGQILEISGPPGCPKERVAINILTSFVEVGEHVIFVDCQNMTSPATISQVLKETPNMPHNCIQLVRYTKIQTLPELIMFMYKLPSLLASQPKTTLLILNSISFLFQFPRLSIATRNDHFERIMQSLTKASASRNVTVVTTSQLATKVLNADGSPGTFDTGGIGVMVPQLGSAYLPTGRTYRIILCPEGPTSGTAKLLASPSLQLKPGQTTERQPYSIASPSHLSALSDFYSA